MLRRAAAGAEVSLSLPSLSTSRASVAVESGDFQSQRFVKSKSDFQPAFTESNLSRRARQSFRDGQSSQKLYTWGIRARDNLGMTGAEQGQLMSLIWARVRTAGGSSSAHPQVLGFLSPDHFVYL